MKNKITTLICCVFISFNLHGQGKSVAIFKELWSEFEQQYAGFELRDIDWEKLFDKYRLQIDKHTDQKQLFEVCCELLHELQDAHVNLIDESGEHIRRCNSDNFPKSTSILSRFSEQEFHDIVDSSLIGKGFAPLKTSQVIGYSKSDDLGYIRISRMAENSEELSKALDELKDTKGVIQI